MRGDNPTTEAVGLGLRIPWIRSLIIPYLRERYREGGGTQVGLARSLGVSDRAIRRWIERDPVLLEELARHPADPQAESPKEAD